MSGCIRNFEEFYDINYDRITEKWERLTKSQKRQYMNSMKVFAGKLWDEYQESGL